MARLPTLFDGLACAKFELLELVRRLIRANFERQSPVAGIATVLSTKETSEESELGDQLADLTKVVRDIATRSQFRDFKGPRSNTEKRVDCW